MIETINNELLQYSHDCNDKLSEMSFMLALSGGVDSMVLSNILIKLKIDHGFSLFFVHVNHNYNVLSDDMEKFVMKFSQKSNIQLFNEDIIISDKENFESASRGLRYKIFNKIAKKHMIDNVLTAHHQNDQIETVFMKMEDGADWISKIGIRKKNGMIRRPMLDIEKEAIINYAIANKIVWIDDPSNKDTSFRRNNVRLKKIPKLISKNKNITFDLLKIANENEEKLTKVINEITNLKKQVIVKDEDEFILIDKDKFLLFTLEEMKLFFYYHIQKKFNYKIKSKTRSFWLQFITFISYGKSGKFFCIDDLKVFINRNCLFVCKKTHLIEMPLDIAFEDKVNWYKTSFNVCKISRPDFSNDKNIFIIPDDIYYSGLKLRTWRKGDKIISSNNRKKVLLSDLFINNKLSIYEKKIQPLMTNSFDEIIWVPGLLHGEVSFLKSFNYKMIKWVRDA